MCLTVHRDRRTGVGVGLSRKLAPSGHEYFALFEEAGANVLRAAELLDEMLSGWPDTRDLAREIKNCEHTGDRITHDLIDRLNHTFVTPIDREDIHRLAGALDDIVDYTEEVADYIGLYRVEAPMVQSQEMAEILLASCREIAKAVPLLRGFQDISSHTIEINRLEDEGDRLTREAIGALFDKGIDPMVVIRWKDLYERLEEAIDSTEDAANIMEGIVIKNR
jgi:predicted phosphate transport protein (TIGR00153 family)